MKNQLKSKFYKLLLYSKVVYYTYFWKFFLGNSEKKSRVYGKINVIHPENVICGSHSTLNANVFLGAGETITISDYVHISPHVIINTGNLNLSEDYKKRDHIYMPVTIEEGVWIASGAIINPGIRIGKKSIVGAGSVVTKNVPEMVIVAGIPAKTIKKLKNEYYQEI